MERGYFNNKFLLPLIVLVTVAATVLIINLNQMVDYIPRWEDNLQMFVVTLLYIALWYVVLRIGYKKRNMFIVGYAGLFWLLNLIPLVLASVFKDPFFPVLKTILPVIFALFGGIYGFTKKLDIPNFYITTYILVAAIFTSTLVTLFCLLKKKHENMKKGSFKTFIKTKQALFIFLALIVLAGLSLYYIHIFNGIKI
jgi:hypothetical protein